MAQVYVSQRVNVLLRDGTVVPFVPGLNDVPSGTESEPFIANLIAASADRVSKAVTTNGALGTAITDLVAAQEALDTAVATAQDTVLTAEESAAETWTTNRQAAIDADEPYNVRHPNEDVTQAVAVTAQPSRVAGSDFIPSPPPTAAPVNVDVPAVMHNGVIVTSAAVGDILTCTMGNWSNTPTSYAYQWQSNGAAVGTDSNSYTVVAGDSGHSIDCVVTATNAIGSTAAPASAAVTIA